MRYIKILGADGSVVAAEAIETPVYVRVQEKNGLIVRCPEMNALGILSADGGTIYQLEGKAPLDGKDMTAIFIDVTEYTVLSESLGASGGDDEDNGDDAGGETAGEDQPTGGTVMTRAEMSARIIALEDELKAAKIMLGVE